MTEKERNSAIEWSLKLSNQREAFGGTVAASAHDLANVFGIILNYAALIAPRLTDHELIADLDEIGTAARFGVSVTTQLVEYSTRHPHQVEEFDIAERLRRAAPLLARLVGPTIALRLTMPSGPFVVSAVVDHLDRALLNLVVNARDAMPVGGTLTVSVDERIEASPSHRQWLVVQVVDTGAGMSAVVLARASDVFMAGGPLTDQSGLGLLAVHRTVERAGGSVTIKSVEGSGTAIEVLLPMAARSAEDVR
jgi:signal transduction histidine kinase